MLIWEKKVIEDLLNGKPELAREALNVRLDQKTSFLILQSEGTQNAQLGRSEIDLLPDTSKGEHLKADILQSNSVCDRTPGEQPGAYEVMVDVNFDRSGMSSSTSVSVSSEIKDTQTSKLLETSMMAIRGCAVNLLQEPMFGVQIMEKDGILQEQQDFGAASLDGLAWVMWLLPRNLQGQNICVPVFRVLSNLNETSFEAWIQIEEGKVSLDVKIPADASNVRMDSAEVLLVPGVWNLVGFQIKGVRSSVVTGRLYPRNDVKMAKWEPVYGFGREASNVCRGLEDSRADAGLDKGSPLR